MSGQLQSNAVSDVMSFGPLLKRLFSFGTSFIGTVKHKRFAAQKKRLRTTCYERAIHQVEKGRIGALRTADKHASDKTRRLPGLLQCCDTVRSVHVACRIQVIVGKLDQHHAEGDVSPREKLGSERQCMTKSAERRHRTHRSSPKPGMSSAQSTCRHQRVPPQIHADSCRRF